MENIKSIKVMEEYFRLRISSHKDAIKSNSRFNEPFITVSRETGAGGTQLGELLISYLNMQDYYRKNDWELFDKNLLARVIQEHDLPAEMAKYVPEKKISEMQGVIEQLFGMHPSVQALIRKTSVTIMHLALLGNIVLVGRGANIITRDLKYGVHLRLINSFANKIKNIQDWFGVEKIKARKIIEDEDRQRKQYIKKYFNCNIDDPSLYSLVINMNSVSNEDAVKIAGDLAINMRK